MMIAGFACRAAKNKVELHEREKRRNTTYVLCVPIMITSFGSSIHINAHKKAPFRREICSKPFYSKQAKEYHDSVHHSNTNVIEKCTICGKRFSSKIT